MSEHVHKILVVDDDEDILSFLELEFSKTPYEVMSASNESDAMDLLRENVFSIAILDIFLSSHKTSNQIINYLSTEESGENQHLPIIVISARIDSDFAEKIRLKGSNIIATMLKPFKLGDFQAFFMAKEQKKALIVNSNPEYVRLMQQELEKLDYNCITTSEVSHASSLLQMLQVDLAFVSETVKEENTLGFLETVAKEQDEVIPIILTEPCEEDRDLMHLNVFAQIEKLSSVTQGLEAVNQIEVWSHHNSGDDFIGNEAIEDLDIESMMMSPEDYQVELESFDGGDEHQPTEMSNEVSETEHHFEVGRDGTSRNEKGMTPLMVAAYEGNANKVKELINSGEKINLKSKSGKTALHYSARSDDIEVSKILIDCGAKVNERDGKQREALYDAIITHNYPLVELLIQSGARTTSRFEGKNFLAVAVLNESETIAKFLCRIGLDPDLKDYNGKSALDYAKKKNMVELYKALKEGL